jgi:hypothetical protein
LASSIPNAKHSAKERATEATDITSTQIRNTAPLFSSRNVALEDASRVG